jgi:hypothetical protein
MFWINGDFDYNGNVNVADLADLAGNFGQSLSGSTATATPITAVSSVRSAASSATAAEPALVAIGRASSGDIPPTMLNNFDAVYRNLQAIWSDARIVA